MSGRDHTLASMTAKKTTPPICEAADVSLLVDVRMIAPSAESKMQTCSSRTPAAIKCPTVPPYGCQHTSCE
eukprot:6975863-Pyramimonas_sp.AAC.1